MAILSPNLIWDVLLSLIGLEWLRRAVWVSLLKKSHPPLEARRFLNPTAPFVSIIVPAKNEEANIEKCLSFLFKQDYPNFEIIVVNDRSTDRTGQILESLSKKSPVPIKVLTIEKLPPGWTGKNHGMFAASKAAQGEWILFTDADTTHEPLSLATALDEALTKKIDFLTLSPETESHSFWEKTVQPLAASSLALWFDPHKVNDSKNPVALANGQFILVKKSVYDASGGNEAVKTEVVEDVALARRTRAMGYSVYFLNGSRLYSTRMYSSLSEIITGWTRILIYLFDKNIPAILHKIFLFLFFSILPFAIALFESIAWFSNRSAFNAPLFVGSLLVCKLIIALRFIGNKLVKTNPWFSFLHPVGSLVMTWILLICIWRILLKKSSVWRGDFYK